MITSARVRELLKARPFRPFRVFLSDGSHHDVPHPEFAWVFGGRMFVGVAKPGPSSSGVKELALLHLTRIEEAPPRKAKKQLSMVEKFACGFACHLESRRR